MFSLWPVALTLLALSITRVAAVGGFPPSVGPPGLCGPDPADASCTAVVEACVSTVTDKNNPYGTEACVAAAACYVDNPDTFLSNFYCRFNNFNGPKSASIPRVPTIIVNKILSNDKIDYQSFAGWYTNVVNSANGNAFVLIDPAFIKLMFDSILAWTGFCNTGDIPPSNFVDWFQWSSTVKGPATTCNLVSNCPFVFYPYAMDLTVTCARDPKAISDPFSVHSCVAAALNWPGDGMDVFLQAVTCRYNIINNSNDPVPASNDLLALSFNLPVANPPPYTQQNFIDFTYGSLSAIGTNFVRWPSTIDWVTFRWAIIAAWTNFCTVTGPGSIPEKNLSDFLKYSHVALSSTTCSGPSTCNADLDPSCQQLFVACLKSSTILTDPFADRNCVLAATCWAGGVKTFGQSITCGEPSFTKGNNPQFWPRLTQTVFDTIGNSQTGKASQQNYIDAFYGALAKLPSPIWPQGDYVVIKWQVITTWTNFPDGNVPYSNFADWLQKPLYLTSWENENYGLFHPRIQCRTPQTPIIGQLYDGNGVVRSRRYHRSTGGRKARKRPRYDKYARTARLTFYGGTLFGPGISAWYSFLNRLKFSSPTKALIYRVWLDQAVLTPFAVAFFFGAMSVLEGKPDEIAERVEKAYVPTLLRNWGVFVPTQIINFSIVPPHLRFVVVSVVGLFWNTYLSMANARVNKVEMVDKQQ